MGSFSNGLVVGLGLSLLFAPMKGEEMRHLVGERLRYLRGTLSEKKTPQQLIEQTGPQLQEVQQRVERVIEINSIAQRAEQVRQAGPAVPATAPEAATTSSTREAQRHQSRAARQTGTGTPHQQRRQRG